MNAKNTSHFMNKQSYLKGDIWIMKTWKNKLCALALVLCGFVPMFMEQDSTALFVSLVVAIPIFLVKKNLIY